VLPGFIDAHHHPCIVALYGALVRLTPPTVTDIPSLQRAIAATGAQRVIVTHGYEAVMVRWLQQQGLEAGSFQTAFGDDAQEAALTSPEVEVPDQRVAVP
jgi:predicted amidohydrolase YtcJ